MSGREGGPECAYYEPKGAASGGVSGRFSLVYADEPDPSEPERP